MECKHNWKQDNKAFVSKCVKCKTIKDCNTGDLYSNTLFHKTLYLYKRYGAKRINTAMGLLTHPKQ